MGKNIYSLVLSDEVVAQIDRMAYAEGTSRSNMINRILAEHVSYTTPEMQTRSIMRRVEELLSGETFRSMGEPSESAFALRSALQYKYNPTVRYSVVLEHEGRSIGELRVTVRSRSDAFTLSMLRFFRLWQTLENAYIGETDCAIETNRFTRRLVPHLRSDGGYTEVAVGDAIAEYIRTFDGAMKAFFARIDSPNEAAQVAEAHIAAYVRNNTVLL